MLPLKLFVRELVVLSLSCYAKTKDRPIGELTIPHMPSIAIPSKHHLSILLMYAHMLRSKSVKYIRRIPINKPVKVLFGVWALLKSSITT